MLHMLDFILKIKEEEMEKIYLNKLFKNSLFAKEVVKFIDKAININKKIKADIMGNDVIFDPGVGRLTIGIRGKNMSLKGIYFRAWVGKTEDGRPVDMIIQRNGREWISKKVVRWKF